MNIVNAKPRWIRLTPPDGGLKVGNKKGMMILGGAIKHVTGTNSFLNIIVASNLTPEAQHICPIAWIPSATASGSFPIFNAQAIGDQSHWSPIILTEGFTLIHGGDAAADAVICILEFDA